MSFFRKSKPDEQPQPKPEKTVGKPMEIKGKPERRVISTDKPQMHPPLKTDEKSQSARLFNRFQKKEKAAEKSYDGEKTVIGKTVAVIGEISGGEEVFVEGRVEGDIYILSKLNIGISGFVAGRIEAQEVRILGKIKGEIKASNRIEIAMTGDVIGMMKTPRIIVSEGASMKGKINTKKPPILTDKKELPIPETKVKQPEKENVEPIIKEAPPPPSGIQSD